MPKEIDSKRFIDQTELYPNKKLHFISIVGLGASAIFIIAGVALGAFLLWILAIPLIILGVAAFLGTMASGIAVGPHIGLHKDYIIWRLFGTRYSFMRWQDVDTVEAGGPEDRPTLILVKGKRMNDLPAEVRINPKNYQKGGKLLEEIVRRHEWAIKSM